MAQQRYISRCQWCGKSGRTGWGPSSGGKPLGTPNVPGKCPSSSNGNHAPQWELA